MRYLMTKEWARFPDDILWRRSKLGLTIAPAERERLAAFMATAAHAEQLSTAVHSAEVEPGPQRASLRLPWGRLAA